MPTEHLSVRYDRNQFTIKGSHTKWINLIVTKSSLRDLNLLYWVPIDYTR